MYLPNAAAAGAGGDGGAGGADGEDEPPDMTGEILLPWNQTKYRKFEKLFEEPCFSSQGILVARMNHLIVRKNKNVESTGFKGVFWKGAFSIFELPIFGWSEKSGKKQTTFSPFTKFLYCFFVKICGSPLYASYIGIRFIYMMLKAFLRTIIIALVGIINTFTLMITGFPVITLPWKKKIQMGVAKHLGDRLVGIVLRYIRINYTISKYQ